MIKANVQTFRILPDEQKLLFENVTIFPTEADMAEYCKRQSSQYHNVCADVVHKWEDNDPEGQQAYFTQLVKRHDITYQYSDDHSVWCKGQHERSVINHYINVIGKDIATAIWNNHINEYFSNEEAREQFSWKV